MDIYKVFNGYRVLLEIVKLRGFDVSDYEGFSKAQIAGMLESNTMDLFFKKEDKKLYVHYELEKSPDLMKLAEQFYEPNDQQPAILTQQDDLFIVAKDNANDSKVELLNDLWENRKIFISVVSLADLQFNKFKAALVPPSFDILSEEETKEIKERFYIMDNQQFPSISRYDALGVLLGIRPGQVCKIQRDSVASLCLDFYRLCI